MGKGKWIPAWGVVLCWVCVVWAAPGGNAAQMSDPRAFELSRMPEAASLPAWMEYLPDPDRKHTWQSALADTAWHPLTRSNLGYLDHPVWTRARMTNTGPESRLVVIFNQRPLMSHISVTILDEEEPVRHLELGFLVTSTPHRALANRVGHFWLELAPGESRTIVARLKSNGVTEAGWKVADAERFARDSLTSFAVLGLYAGITLALIAHGLVSWLFFQRREYGLMVGYAASFLFFLISITGLARVFDFNLPPAFWSTGSYIFPLLSHIFWLSFADYMLGARRTMPLGHRALRILQVLLAGVICFFLLAAWFPEIYSWGIALPALILMLYATVLAVALRAVRLRLEMSWLFLIGHVPVFVASGMLFVFLQAAILRDIDTILHIQPLLVILQVAFMTSNLGLLHKKSMRTHLEHQRFAIEQSRFASVGRTIGMVVHQWRTPLARLGTQLAELRASFRSEEHLRRRTTLIRDELLPDMEDGLHEMISTMNDFRDFFSANRPRETFAPEHILNQVLDMLGSRLIGVRLERQPAQDSTVEDTKPDPAPHSAPPVLLHGHPSALAHVLMVLLGNALDTLQQRHIADPHLYVAMDRNPATGDILISVEDNAGGVYFRPLEQVFETFVSEKGDQHMGMGLGIAKKLVEERMGGAIQVENTARGARFTIRLPDA